MRRRRQGPRGDNRAPGSPVVVLGEVEICLPPPRLAEAARRVEEAVDILRQRCVSEEDATRAIDALEAAGAAPLSYAGAWLCLAEVYLVGAAPQHGEDRGRALECLLLALAAEPGLEDADVVAGTAIAVDGMAAEELAPHAPSLLQLASDCPELRGAALRAHIAASSGSVAPPPGGAAVAAAVAARKRGGSSEALLGPLQLLQALLADVAHAEDERCALESALEEAHDRGSKMELTSMQLAARLERSEGLVAGLEKELQRTSHAERQLQRAQTSAQELAVSVRHLQNELQSRDDFCRELEARNNALSETLMELQSEMSQQLMQQELQHQQHLRQHQQRQHMQASVPTSQPPLSGRHTPPRERAPAVPAGYADFSQAVAYHAQAQAQAAHAAQAQAQRVDDLRLLQQMLQEIHVPQEANGVADPLLGRGCDKEEWEPEPIRVPRRMSTPTRGGACGGERQPQARPHPQQVPVRSRRYSGDGREREHAHSWHSGSLGPAWAAGEDFFEAPPEESPRAARRISRLLGDLAT